ncbi:HEPN domain-containing protein [Limosilactobacillus sp. c11Ua_112_M]|uniref:HEPN domain-containing protein n=1 Tax=Limosilactobacillus TaxID=2742598 RepID=UPI00178087A8|nr:MULTISPECIES: HEPN domain-containing protein [Limosilactobacillus]MBD8088160.1 HEPN domain-containing protein [Limosilactobacillus portuensis]MEC4742702.1 HEPN domain-containing protein [Limosilactobacillus sp. c10Ua_36]
MFNWKDYLCSAKQLAKKTDECSKRMAISRAYYAAFNYTKHKRIYGTEFSGSKSHEDMWREAFRDESESRIFDDALTLKDFRVHVDYRSSSHNISNECEKSLKIAEKIINFVDQVDD